MRKLISIAGVIFFAANLHAAKWEEYGFKIVNSSQEDDKTTLELKDSEGRALTVFFSGNVSDKSIPVVANLQKILYAWKSMQVKTIRYTLLENNIVEVQVFPSAFSDENVDFMKNIPGHLFFIYKDQLQYSFRLEVNKLFVKIKGYYTDETDLLKKIKQAVKDPQGFIIKRDPEYFIAKLEKLEEELEAQKGLNHRQEKELERMRAATVALHNTGVFSGPEVISEKLLLRVVELKKQNPAWKREQIQTQLDLDKIEWSKKQVKLILSVYFSEFE
jgi:hypothetical protein